MSRLHRLPLGPLAARILWAARSLQRPNVRPWIRLDAAEVQPAEKVEGQVALDWIQVAAEGNYKGHAAGEFTLDRAVFENIIRNLRAHPSFRFGATGKGTARVVPFDWRHASEQSPQAPDAILAQHAQGWVYDLEIRTGADGKAALWALAEMFEPAKSLIKEGKIQWTSVTIWPHAVDPITASDIGWYLSSIALTNDPFIQGMQPIRISASRYYDPYDRPETASELVEQLRRMFGLAEMADLGTVLSQVGTLRAAATGATQAPPGVDVNELVGALRCLFNLPTLATVEQVFAEADKLLAALADEEAAESSRRPQALGAARPAAPPQNNPHRPETQNMDPKLIALIALMAGGLGIQANATPEAVEVEWKKLGLDRQGVLKTLLDLPKALASMVIATTKALALEAGADAAAKTATDKVKAMLAALGVADVESACNELLSQVEKSRNLVAAIPELDQMLDERMNAAHDEAADDVATALELRGYSIDQIPHDPICADLADAMSVRRCAGVDISSPEAIKRLSRAEKIAVLKKLDAARGPFIEKYAPRDEQAAPMVGGHYLTRSMFARYGTIMQQEGQTLGAQRGAQSGRGQPAGFARESGQQGQGAQRQGELDPTLDLSRYSGNLTERALAAAAARMGAENWRKLGRVEQYAKANEVKAILREAGHDLTEYMGEAAADAG